MKKIMVTMILSILIVCMLAGCGKNPSEDGTELMGQKKYEEAADKFQEAIDNKKNVKDAYRGLGMAKWELGDYEGAKDAFLKALKEDTEESATLYNFLGSCDMQLGNPESALNYYRLGMAVEGCAKELMQEMKFNEISAYEQMKDWESARTKLKDYTEKYPEDERAAKEAEFLETR